MGLNEHGCRTDYFGPADQCVDAGPSLRFAGKTVPLVSLDNEESERFSFIVVLENCRENETTLFVMNCFYVIERFISLVHSL